MDVARCAGCGEPVDTEEWHPFDVDVGADGETRVYVFCSRACHADWEPE